MPNIWWTWWRPCYHTGMYGYQWNQAISVCWWCDLRGWSVQAYTLFRFSQIMLNRPDSTWIVSFLRQKNGMLFISKVSHLISTTKRGCSKDLAKDLKRGNTATDIKVLKSNITNIIFEIKLDHQITVVPLKMNIQ